LDGLADGYVAAPLLEICLYLMCFAVLELFVAFLMDRLIRHVQAYVRHQDPSGQFSDDFGLVAD
jgi:hypothetical protein